MSLSLPGAQSKSRDRPIFLQLPVRTGTLVIPSESLAIRSRDNWSRQFFIDNLTNEHPELTRYSEVLGNPVHRDFTFRPLTVGVTAAYRY